MTCDMNPMVITIQQQASACDWVTAVFAFMSACGAIGAAVVAYLAYSNSKAPNVIAYLESTHSNDYIHFVVRNIGNGCAHDVKIKGFDFDMAEPGGDLEMREDARRSFVKKGIPMLAPGQIRKTAICSKEYAHRNFPEGVCEIVVQWHRVNPLNIRRKCPDATFSLDYYSFAMSQFVRINKGGDVESNQS